jgi:protein ImuA
LRPIFWIADRFCQLEAGDFYGPGLYPLGIDPGREVPVFTRDFGEAIWAAGEVSRTDKIGFALLEVRGNPHKLDLTVTRQLLLRCQENQAPFFILRQAGQAQTSAVLTRWLVEPALSQDLRHRFGQNLGGQNPGRQNSERGADNSNLVGMTTWNVSLEKCRGGKTGNWTLEWNHHEQAFKIAGQFSGRKSNHANQYQSAGYQKQQYEGKPA